MLKTFFKDLFTRQTLSYLIIGLSKTFIGWAETYALNNWLHLGYWPTSIIVFVIGFFYSYFMNRKFTYTDVKTDGNTFRKYVIEVLICFVLAYGLGKIILAWFFGNVVVLSVSDDMLNTLEGILANIAFIGLDYIGQRYFVFKK